MIYIFNTTIAPTAGLTYHTRTITAEQARRILADASTVTSAIGHEATAQIAATVLDYAPLSQVNRIAAAMVAGDAAICVKLRGRAPEGVILSAAEVEAIGYDLVLMSACDQSAVADAIHRRTDPESDNVRPDAPPLEVCAALLVTSFDSWVKQAHHAGNLAGLSYQGSLAYDDLRSSMLTLCREIIDRHIAAARADVPCDADGVRSVREGLVSRLVDVLQERGEAVACRPIIEIRTL